MKRNRYMLITVYERKIETKLFENHQDAYVQMLKELEKNFIDAYGELCDWEEVKSYGDTYRTDRFGFSKSSAWSNFQMDYKCDWKIVEV